MNCEFETLVKAQHAGATLTDDGANKYVQFASSGNKVAILPNTSEDEEVWKGAYNKHLADNGSATVTRDFDQGARAGDNYIIPISFDNDVIPVLKNISSRAAAASSGSIAAIAGVASVAAGASKASTGSLGAVASIAAIASTASIGSVGALGNFPSTGSVGSAASAASFGSRASAASTGSLGSSGSMAAVASYASRASYAGQCYMPERKGLHPTPKNQIAGMQSLSQDTNPTLGGDLILGSNKIEGDSPTINVTETNGHVQFQEEGVDKGELRVGAPSWGLFLKGAANEAVTLQSGSSKGVTILDKGGNVAYTTDYTLDKFTKSNAWHGYQVQTTDPATASNIAHIYAKDVSTVAEMFVQDEGGTATQISAHSRLAPDSLYDSDDPSIDMVVQEIQYFQGFVRFTNKTRMAKLAALTDAQKSAMEASKLECVIKESFSDYNTRAGQNLKILDWDTEEQRKQDRYDAERAPLLAKRKELELLKVGEADLDKLNKIDDIIEEIDSVILPEANIKKPKPDWL